MERLKSINRKADNNKHLSKLVIKLELLHHITSGNNRQKYPTANIVELELFSTNIRYHEMGEGN